MNFKLLLIFSLSLLTIASSQSLFCNFQMLHNSYTCMLTIDNPDGVDVFSGIHGFHMDGRTNDDVFSVNINAGITTIIPRVICDSFRNIRRFDSNRNVGIQRLTENALSSCTNLLTFTSFSNPVTEIHPNFLRNNVNLVGITFVGLLATSIPGQLFSTTPNLDFISIGISPFLRDLPVDLFRNTPRLNSLRLNHNGLTVWRPEWTQSSPHLNALHINDNQFSEMPRNAINLSNLTILWAGQNNYIVLDYLMFNDISKVSQFDISDSPVEAIDFNLIDMATDLDRLSATGCKCVDRDLDFFNTYREANMAELEPCFVAFDNRRLSKT